MKPTPKKRPVRLQGFLLSNFKKICPPLKNEGLLLASVQGSLINSSLAAALTFVMTNRRWVKHGQVGCHGLGNRLMRLMASCMYLVILLEPSSMEPSQFVF